MVINCCVKGCNNKANSAKNSLGISFHAFPSKKELRQKWLRAIGRPYWNPPNYVRICSAHFRVDQINQDGSRVRIKEDAFPVEELPPACSFSASDVEVCRICLITDVRLFSLEYGKLKVCMEALAELGDKNTILDLPQFVCYECGAQLLKYNKLIEKSLVAQAILLDIFADNGRITKRLVKKKDRAGLNLQSSLGYSESADVIELNNCSDSDASLNEFPEYIDIADNDLENVDVCKDELKVDCKRKLNVHRFYGNAKNDQFNLKQLSEDNNLKLKSEETDLDSDNPDYEIEKVDLKIEDDENIEVNKQLGETLKTEYAVPKCEMLDSDSNHVTETFKISRKNNKKAKSNTTENIEKPDSDLHDLKEVFENLEEVFKSSEESDGSVKSYKLSNDESSEDENLLSIKNNAKYKKLSQATKVGTKKTSSGRVYKKNGSDKMIAEAESSITKLKNYNIKDLTLQEQIEAWINHNKESVQYSQYHCEICTRKFVRKKAYEKHLPKHEESRGQFECPVCKERYRNKIRLSSHRIRNHDKKYECQKCFKIFYTLEKAQRHADFHSERVYKCPHCAFSTTRRSTAWEHVRSQHAHAHHCALCGHTFINAKGLGTHTAMSHPGQHGEPKTPFPCEQCDIVFHSEAALRVHKLVSIQHKFQAKAPDESPPKPTCKRCGKVFASRRHMYGHARKEHSRPHARPRRPRPPDPAADAYPRPCEHCEKELKTRFEHWCHVRREHPEHKHLYKKVVSAICATCGKGFQSKTMLSRHEQKHLGPARLACPQCARRFHDEYSLGRHARVHQAAKDFACSHCGKAFRVKGNLERHLRYAHTPDTPYQCTECGKAFKVKSNFKRHLRTHTGETPYMCKYCGKKFRYWESLTLHEKHTHQKVPWPTRDRSVRKRPAELKDDATAED